jgi:hypothetical protein
MTALARAIVRAVTLAAAAALLAGTVALLVSVSPALADDRPMSQLNL